MINMFNTNLLNIIPNRFFIAGTDTGIGKTHIAHLLLRMLKREGKSTIALKPISTGGEKTAQGLRNEDACILQDSASQKLKYEEINPFCFPQPIAPHIAAIVNHIDLSVSRVINTCQRILKYEVDFIIIEGVGGWLCPINDYETMADLARALGYSVILVVGMRLGCINHALLTVNSIKTQNISLAGWIANCIDPTMLYLSENIKSLEDLIDAPLLGVVPWIPACAGIQ